MAAPGLACADNCTGDPQLIDNRMLLRMKKEFQAQIWPETLSFYFKLRLIIT